MAYVVRPRECSVGALEIGLEHSLLGLSPDQCWASFGAKGQEKLLFRGTSGKLPRASKSELGEKFAHLGEGKSLAYAATATGSKYTWKALLAGTVLPGNDIDGNGVITPEEFPGM